MTKIKENAQRIDGQLPADVSVAIDELISRLDTLVNDFQVPIDIARKSLVEAYQQEQDSEFGGSTSDFVAVDIDKLHVWYRDKHYLGVGTAYKVEKGQLFYFSRGISPEDPPTVTKVTEIIERSSGKNVKLDDNTVLNSEALTGEVLNMAQQSPPSLLVDPVKVDNLDKNVIEKYLHKIGDGEPVDYHTLIQEICKDHNTDPAVVESEIQEGIKNKHWFYATRGMLEPW